MSSSPITPTIPATKTILINLLCLILVALALLAFIFSFSSLITVRPAKQVEYWENYPEKFNEELASQLINRAIFAIKLNPTCAECYLVTGQLYEASNNFDSAEKYYRLAIEKQPTWDYAWARLAKLYSTNQQHSNMLKALSKAIALGRYEGDTQEITIPLILENWDALAHNEDDKKVALSILRHSLNYYPHNHLTLNTAKQHGQLALLLTVAEIDWVKKRIEDWLKEETPNE